MKRYQTLYLILFGVLLHSCGPPYKKSLRVYTVATVTQPNVKKTSEKYDYSVSIIDYQTDSLHHLEGKIEADVISGKLCKDEKFVLLYKKNNPSSYVVYIDKPVFLDTEPVVETVGTIERVSPLVWDAGVDFSYPVNETQKQGAKKDKSLTKFQHIAIISGEKSRRRQFPDLKIGKKYLVKYSPTDPQRAVIYLDKPLHSDSK